MRLERMAERTVVVDGMLAERHAGSFVSGSLSRRRSWADRTAAAVQRHFTVERVVPPTSASRRSRPRERRRRPRRAARSRRRRAGAEATRRVRIIPVTTTSNEFCMRLFRIPLSAQPRPDRVAGPDDAAHFRRVFGNPARIRRGACLSVAIPLGMIDVDHRNLDAMVAGVAYQLRGLVKTDWLGVQDRRAKNVGVVGLEPAGSLGQREKRRHGFRENRIRRTPRSA